MKWNRPGIDKVPNLSLNVFESIQDNTRNCLNKSMTNPKLNPKWFAQGVINLLLKSNETKNICKNYQLKTCLPTMYKMLTSIITERT